MRVQELEAAALKGSEIGAHYISALAHTVLSVVSIQAAAALVRLEAALLRAALLDD